MSAKFTPTTQKLFPSKPNAGGFLLLTHIKEMHFGVESERLNPSSTSYILVELFSLS